MKHEGYKTEDKNKKDQKSFKNKALAFLKRNPKKNNKVKPKNEKMDGSSLNTTIKSFKESIKTRSSKSMPRP